MDEKIIFFRFLDGKSSNSFLLDLSIFFFTIGCLVVAGGCVYIMYRVAVPKKQKIEWPNMEEYTYKENKK
jgi:hypothetical protein